MDRVDARTCLVYLGGMGRVRAVTRTAVTICVASVFLLLVLHSNGWKVDAAPFIVLHVAALAISVGVRLCAMRAISFVGCGWILCPLLGKPRHMRPVVDVYATADDVVVLDRDGRVILLGVDGLLGRDAARARQILVEALRQPDRLAA